VRRAGIWTVSGGVGYTGKPRPAVIVQDDHFDTGSGVLCPFTTDSTGAPLFRLLIGPAPGNGLAAPSRIMVDKITTVRRSRLGQKVGVLDDANILRLKPGAGGVPGDCQQHMTSLRLHGVIDRGHTQVFAPHPYPPHALSAAPSRSSAEACGYAGGYLAPGAAASESATATGG
jgi:mRNA interferase MazF